MKISIEGMHCQACVNRVRKALEKVEGVHVEDVQIGSANLVADKSKEAEALAAIEKAGYQPHIAA
jgi:copper chaperone